MSAFSNVSLSEIGINAIPIPIRDANFQLHLIATTGIFNSVTGGTAVTTAGGIVKRWEDQSGSNSGTNRAVQSSTALAPILVLNAQNSLPALRFTSDVLELIGESVGGLNCSIFVVFKNNDATNGSLLFSSTAAPSIGGYIGVITNSSYNADGRDKFVFAEDDNGNGNSGKLAFSGGSAGSNYIIGSCFVSTSSAGVARLNGVAGVNVGTVNSADIFIYLGGNISPYELKADIGEILCYNRLLDESERLATEQYLKSKWAVY
jgi:hypothetical protein